MVSVPPRTACSAGGWSARLRAASTLRGRNTLKAVPLPGSLSTSIHPWCCLTMPYTVARPRPVPFPTSLVVKNGSKMRRRVLRRNAAAGIDRRSGRRIGRFALSECSARRRASTSTVEILIASRPPLGMASRELTARFNSTCSIMPASACTSAGCGRVIQLQGDIFSQDASQHLGHVADHLVHVQPPRLHAPAAG